MSSFLTAVTKTLQYEGGLVENSADPGGLTNFGISLRAHPELGAAGIRALTPGAAMGIYQREYWSDLFDEIRNQPLANALFDFGVTSGIKVATQTLQGVIFIGGGAAIDGIFGAETLSAINKADPRQLLRDFITERLRFYTGLNKPEFLHSWFSRTIDALL